MSELLSDPRRCRDSFAVIIIFKSLFPTHVIIRVDDI